MPLDMSSMSTSPTNHSLALMETVNSFSQATTTLTLLPTPVGDGYLLSPLDLHSGNATAAPLTSTAPSANINRFPSMTPSHTMSERSPDCSSSVSSQHTNVHSASDTSTPGSNVPFPTAITSAVVQTRTPKGLLVAAILPGFLVTMGFLVCLAFYLKRKRRKALKRLRGRLSN
ncbi:hypothetical protein EV426DRAFT_712559 [Tirmania nivea]|nr:hypothetical protein EV426DRAFT_712559 [Tirmania nivea]